MSNADSGFVAGFVRDAKQSAAGKAAAERLAECRPDAPKRKLAPRVAPIVVNVNPSIIIPTDIKVRRVEDILALTPEEKQKPRKERAKKPPKAGKVTAPELGMRSAIVRTVEHQKDEIVYVGKPTEARIQLHGARMPVGGSAMYTHHSDRFSDLKHLPKILSEDRTEIPAAFNAARKIGVDGRVDLRPEGVRYGVVGEKDKVRVEAPAEPSWFLYHDGQSYPIPHDFPRKDSGVIKLDRLQAAYVAKMIMNGMIDLAIFALPLAEGEEFSKQWKHTPKLQTIVHCDGNGKAIATNRVVGFEAKETKPDEDRYQVTIFYSCADTATKAESEAQQWIREEWRHTEAQAISLALRALEFGGGRGTPTDTGSIGGAVKVIITVSGKRELDSNRYNPAFWTFEAQQATLTRVGYAKLQVAPKGDEFKPGRKRGAICTRNDYNRSTTWQKAKSDRSTFSHG